MAGGSGCDSGLQRDDHRCYHRLVDSVHFVNTGSVGRPKDGNPRAGYCILTISEADVTSEQIRVPCDVELACERLLAVGLPPYFADYLRTGGALLGPAE